MGDKTGHELTTKDKEITEDIDITNESNWRGQREDTSRADERRLEESR